MFARPSFFSAASRLMGSNAARSTKRRCEPRVVGLEDRALLSTGVHHALHHAEVQHLNNQVANALEHQAILAIGTVVKFPGGFVISNPFGTVVKFPGGSVKARPRHTHVTFPGGFVISNPGGTVVKFPGGSVIVP